MARWITCLLVTALLAGCDRIAFYEEVLSISATASVPPPDPHALDPAAWQQLFAERLGKGVFEVRTQSEAITSPVSGRRCAYLAVIYMEEGDGERKRFDMEEWPRTGPRLTIGDTTLTARSLSFKIPSFEKILVPGPDVADKARAVFERGAQKVKATEDCLAPDTTYRAELQEKEPAISPFGDIGPREGGAGTPMRYMHILP